MLAPSYSRLATTIASRGLNCRVRNENGCGPSDEALAHNTEMNLILRQPKNDTKRNSIENKSRLSQPLTGLFCRHISTPRLNALLHLHLVPINVVISHESITIPHLGVGFPLRCFQRLSFPDIATGRCSWRNSPQTSGQFIPVLSSFTSDQQSWFRTFPHFHGAQTISSPVPEHKML